MVTFKFYVMNNLEIVIDYYLHITTHIFHAVTSCIHFTSYSLLNLVYEILCEFGLAIQEYILLWFWYKNVFIGLKIWGQKVWKYCFWSSGLKTNVFEKLSNSFSCISFMKLFDLIVFCIIFYSFLKIQFSRISIYKVWFLINRKFSGFWSLLLPNSIGIRSMLDESKLKNFQFLSVWPNFFFMHHLCLRFTFFFFLFSISILQFCSHISLCFQT